MHARAPSGRLALTLGSKMPSYSQQRSPKHGKMAQKRLKNAGTLMHHSKGDMQLVVLPRRGQFPPLDAMACEHSQWIKQTAARQAPTGEHETGLSAPTRCHSSKSACKCPSTGRPQQRCHNSMQTGMHSTRYATAQAGTPFYHYHLARGQHSRDGGAGVARGWRLGQLPAQHEPLDCPAKGRAAKGKETGRSPGMESQWRKGSATGGLDDDDSSLEGLLPHGIGEHS